jgi:hypothetical protein
MKRTESSAVSAAPTGPTLTSDDIRWEPAPLPEIAVPADPIDALVQVLVESQSYRELAQQAMAIHALHREMRDHARLREQYRRVVDEYRNFRASLIRESA